MNKQQTWIFMSHVHIKVKGFPLWGHRRERQIAGSVWVSHGFIVVQIGSHAEHWKVSEQTMLKELKVGQKAEETSTTVFLLFQKKWYIYKIDENNLFNVLHPFVILTCFFLRATLSFLHCQSLSLIYLLSLCNQIGLSYTHTALWLLAAGFRCLQSGCTFQQANDCGRMKL